MNLLESVCYWNTSGGSQLIDDEWWRCEWFIYFLLPLKSGRAFTDKMHQVPFWNIWMEKMIYSLLKYFVPEVFLNIFLTRPFIPLFITVCLTSPFRLLTLRTSALTYVIQTKYITSRYAAISSRQHPTSSLKQGTRPLEFCFVKRLCSQHDSSHSLCTGAASTAAGQVHWSPRRWLSRACCSYIKLTLTWALLGAPDGLQRRVPLRHICPRQT